MMATCPWDTSDIGLLRCWRSTEDSLADQIGLDFRERCGFDLREASRVFEVFGISFSREIPFGLILSLRRIVKNRGDANRVCSALGDHLMEMLERARPAARDHRNAHRAGNPRRQFQVKSLGGSFSVYRGHHYFSGAEYRRLHRPSAGIHTGLVTAIVKQSLVGSVGLSNGLDGNDDRGGAELLCCLSDQLGSLNSRRVQRHFVCSRAQGLADVFQGPKPSPNGEGNEDLLRSFRHDFQETISLIETRDDIHVKELVRPLLIIVMREPLGFPQDAQSFEVDSLHEIRSFDVKARDDSYAQTRRPPLAAPGIFSLPPFS